MYFGRFNYVSDCEKDGQRVLMNFLSRSCDIIDEESALIFSQKKGTLSAEEREYAAERGYLFPHENEERKILQELYTAELSHERALSVVYLDMIDGKIKGISEKIKSKPGSLILYSENTLDPEIPAQVAADCSLKSTHVMTSCENLTSFELLFRKHIASQVTVMVSVSPDCTPFAEDTESLLDALIEHGIPVEIVARLSGEHVKSIRPMMNYFIYKGWPFLENFTCHVEPEKNQGCIFGYWYSNSGMGTDLPRAIFQEYAAHPQTEFCSVEKWVGINPVHSLIWTGKPSLPSFHFCEASRDLTVYTDGDSVPCFNLAGKSGDAKEFRNKNGRTLSECQKCVYALSCGGGCKLRAEKGVCCPPVKQLIEVSLEHYFDEFLQRLNFYQEYGGIQ